MLPYLASLVHDYGCRLLRRRRRPFAWRSRSRASASLAAASASACSLCFLLCLAARLFSFDVCLRCSSRRCSSSARLPPLCFSLSSLAPLLGFYLRQLSVGHAHAVPLTHYRNRETVSIVGHHKYPASTSRNPHR